MNRTTGPSMSIVMRVSLLAIGPALGLGLARFAYALVLPAMKADLGWSYALAGFVNTVNALGYLAGALLSAWMNRRFGRARVFSAGILLTMVSILGPGLSSNIVWICLFRFAAGYAGAMAFISGGALATDLARTEGRRAGFLIGLFYAGTGFGIALSGLFVPPMLGWLGPSGWPALWDSLFALSLVLGLAALPATRGLASGQASGTPPASDRRLAIGAIAPIFVAYVLFGAGSIATMTFMFTFLAEAGATAWMLSAFWVLIGSGVMVSPWLWGRLMTGLKAGRAFAVLTAINAVGAALPLVSGHGAFVIASAAIFGATFLAVVASTTAFVHRYADASDYARSIALFAIAFALGQTAGPMITGAVTDRTGSLSDGLLLGVVLIVAACVVALTQRHLTHGEAERG